MGKLITVVGNSGVGKSTFVKVLCKAGSFTSFLEETDVRPFLQRFKDNKTRFCLANQVDFLLLQAEEATYAGDNDVVAVQDGGLDESFHVFTKRFHQKGFLADDEFYLCERLYSALRRFSPSPDLIINLTAPLSVIAERMASRGRAIDIEGSDDLIELEKLIDLWLESNTSIPVIHLDTTRTDSSYASIIPAILDEVKAQLNI